jgi:tetratricopeptide (TPR) repeat protein
MTTRRRERRRGRSLPGTPTPASRAAPARPGARPDARPRATVAAGPVFPALAPDPRWEARASRRWLLPAVLGLGLVLRLLHLAFVRDSPFFGALQLDAQAYDAWAQRIAAGEWIGREPFWVDPLYAYVLAGIYRLAGHDLLLPRLVNIGCGVATALVVAGIARRVWASRLAAVVAALLVVLFIPVIHFEGQIEKTALSVLLLACGLALFLSGTWRAIAAAGVVTGLATLARGNGLLFIPLGALALWRGWDRDPENGSDAIEQQGIGAVLPTGKAPVPVEAAARHDRVQRAGLWLACALPVVALATIHNYCATGTLVFTTYNLGVNLYLGNHAGNLYGYYEPPAFLNPNSQGEVPDFQAEALRRSGRQLAGGALSSYWAGQTWAALLANPGLAVVRTVHKLRLVLHDIEIPDTDGADLVGEWSPVLRLPVVWFGQLLPLALLGAVVGWRRRGVRVVAAVAVTYIASLLPFFIMARLRVQLVPPLAVLAAGGVVWLVSAACDRRWRSLAYAAALVALVAVVVDYPPEWMAKRRRSSLAIQWNNLGGALKESGHPDEAVRAYRRAVDTDDAAVPASLRELGSYYQGAGDYLQAERAMRRVLELRPNSPSARDALRRLYDVMLADPRWRDDASIRERRRRLEAENATAGNTPGAGAGAANTAAAGADPIRSALAQARSLRAAGRFDDAIAVLQAAVRQGPYDENLHYLLGDLMAQHASADAMVQFWSAEVSHDQKPQTSQYFWAVGLARRGDVDAATAHLRTALEIDPAHEMSQRQWGLLLEQQGRLDEALEHLTEATRIHPEFKDALLDAARVAERLGRGGEAAAYRSRAATANPNSIRQYVYWARYLHAHGRDAAAAVEVERMLAQRPDDVEALRLREDIRAAAIGGRQDVAAGTRGATAAPTAAAPATRAAAGAGAVWSLSSESHAAMVAQLAKRPAAAATWILYDTRQPSAEALARQLASAFEAAGWSVRRLAGAPVPLRAGLFVFAADDPPPQALATIASALAAAQLHPTTASGYREFTAARRRADPNWRGIELDADQSFVIAVGRPPDR